jgi:hypothetical protein
LSWSIDYSFGIDSLKNFDPLPLMLQSLMEVAELRPYRSDIYTVLRKLYNNALDHGVLKLEPHCLKNFNNLSEYNQQKAQKLATLTSGKIKAAISLSTLHGRAEVNIVMTDTGDGLHLNRELSRKTTDESIIRTEFEALKTLCSELTFNESGNEVRAKMIWLKNENF